MLECTPNLLYTLLGCVFIQIKMEAKDEKFKIEVRFSKNRHYPEYGSEAYSIESHSIYIPYGKRFDFKNSNKAIDFVKSRIDSKVLEHFDSICITKWRGYVG